MVDVQLNDLTYYTTIYGKAGEILGKQTPNTNTYMSVRSPMFAQSKAKRFGTYKQKPTQNGLESTEIQVHLILIYNEFQIQPLEWWKMNLSRFGPETIIKF